LGSGLNADTDTGSDPENRGMPPDLTEQAKATPFRRG